MTPHDRSGASPESARAAAIHALERPHARLMWRYAISSMLLGPFFFVALIPLAFRFVTLRYRFDREGVSMRWGVLVRREINLTYARIQDIHLSSSVIDRWLGLARIEIQTASGSGTAEMVIEGLLEFEEIRDYLYDNMRGARGRSRDASMRPPGAAQGAVVDAATVEELTRTLREVTEELRAIRSALGGDRKPGEP